MRPAKKNGEKKAKGKIGEHIALYFIYSNGGVLKDLNWTCRWGEIDLIYYDGKGILSPLVFCEVKYRCGDRFGNPNEAISAHKVRSQKRAIQNYLLRHGLENANWRFDVISILNLGERMDIIQYQSAFDLSLK